MTKRKPEPTAASLAAAALRAARTEHSTPAERSAQARHAATQRWSQHRKSVIKITLDGRTYQIPLDWLEAFTANNPKAGIPDACAAWQHEHGDNTPDDDDNTPNPIPPEP